jgi:hypothetical protein
LPRFRTSSIGLFSPPAGGQLNEYGTLAARALIAPRRHSRADLHCMETVDYPCCRNDLSDQSKACRPRPYCIPVPVRRFSRNDSGGGVRRSSIRNQMRRHQDCQSEKGGDARRSLCTEPSQDCHKRRTSATRAIRRCSAPNWRRTGARASAKTGGPLTTCAFPSRMIQ